MYSFPQAFPSFPTVSPSHSEIVPRGRMSKEEYREYLQSELGILPGSSAYIGLAEQFFPLQIKLGHEVDSGRPVSWCPLDEINPSKVITGSSGSGKTFVLKKIASQFALHGMPFLIFDLHGDVKIPFVNDIMISSGYSSQFGVNPLEIDSFDASKRSLYDQRMALVSMVKRAIPTLSPKQCYFLSSALETAYVCSGIEDSNPATWRYAPPRFSDVLAVLRGWMFDPEFKAAHASIGGCVAALEAVFGHPIFNRTQNVSVSSFFKANTRLDLSQLEDRAKVIVAETVLRMVMNALMAMGHFCPGAFPDSERCRFFVLIDETKILAMGNGDPDKHSNTLNVVATEGRKFGLGVVLASQTAEHFGRDVRRNIASRLVLRCVDFDEAKRNALDMQLPPEKLLELSGGGDGYFRTGSSRWPIRIHVDQFSDNCSG